MLEDNERFLTLPCSILLFFFFHTSKAGFSRLLCGQFPREPLTSLHDAYGGKGNRMSGSVTGHTRGDATAAIARHRQSSWRGRAFVESSQVIRGLCGHGWRGLVRCHLVGA